MSPSAEQTFSHADVEFLIEPFIEGEIGSHVRAGIDAVDAHGLRVDVGPFGNTTSGPLDIVSAAVGDLTREAMDAGADRVSVSVRRIGTPATGERPRGLHNALDRIISSVELELGAPLDELERQQKQAAVRLLDESGAFQLRKAIEDVAEHMGVSRITIYNYLNAIRDESR